MSEKQNYKNRQPIPNNKLRDIARLDEERLIALLLKDKDTLSDVMDNTNLSYKHFLWEEHAGMFNYIAKYYGKYEAILTRDTFRTVTMEKLGTDEAARLTNAFNTFYSKRANTEDYKRIRDGIFARYAQQEFFTATRGGEWLAEIIGGTTDQRDSIKKFAEKIDSIASNINESEEDKFSSVDMVSDILPKLIDDLQSRREIAIEDRGIICGIDAYDSVFQGFRHGKYGVFLGLPNGGKTTMMLNFAFNMAKLNYKVAYVTIESTGIEVTERLLSNHTRIESKRLRRGGKGDDGLNDEVMNKILFGADELQKIMGSNLCLITVNQKTPVNEILAKVNRKLKYMDFDVVYFDYLDVIGHMVRNQGRPDLDILDTSQRIQSWGKQRNIAVWSAQSLKNDKISEIRKKDFLENAEKSSITVGVESIGGSQGIARDADYAIAVIPHPGGGRLISYITKARTDAPANLKFVLEWMPEICLVSDYSEYCISPEDMQSICSKGGMEYLNKLAEEGDGKPGEVDFLTGTPADANQSSEKQVETTVNTRSASAFS